MGYPSTYSTDSDLFGDILDQFIMTLTADLNSSSTTLYVDRADVYTPCFILVENELMKVTNADAGGKTLTVQRGYGGTTATAHTKNTPIYLVISSDHFKSLRNGIVNLQKYAGLVGLDANKPSNPPVGAVYIATDTKRVYIALNNGQWVSIFKQANHSEYPEVGDPHPQYHTSQRFYDWHSAQAGGHVTGGDNHDHSSGGGIARVKAGLDANKGSVSGSGWVYYATDTNYFYIANNGSWVRIAGAPSGMIAMFLANDLSGNCPPGWTRVTELDGKFPKGAPSGTTSLASGGSASHTHTYSAVPAHTHAVPAVSATTSTDGGHTHSVPARGSPYGTGFEMNHQSYRGYNAFTDYGGDHYHTGVLPGSTSGSAQKVDGSTGVSSGTTGSASNYPPYRRVIFCKKV